MWRTAPHCLLLRFDLGAPLKIEFLPDQGSTPLKVGVAFFHFMNLFFIFPGESDSVSGFQSRTQ